MPAFGQVARLDYALQVGAVAESREVSARPVLLDSETSSLGQVVGGRQVTELPLLGRSAYSLAALVSRWRHGVRTQGRRSGDPARGRARGGAGTHLHRSFGRRAADGAGRGPDSARDRSGTAAGGRAGPTKRSPTRLRSATRRSRHTWAACWPNLMPTIAHRPSPRRSSAGWSRWRSYRRAGRIGRPQSPKCFFTRYAPCPNPNVARIVESTSGRVTWCMSCIDPRKPRIWVR